jgi:hypothetical protein
VALARRGAADSERAANGRRNRFRGERSLYPSAKYVALGDALARVSI